MADNKKTDSLGLIWDMAPPVVKPKEGALAKGWRIATQPVVDSLPAGVKEAIDKWAAPGSGGDMETVIKDVMNKFGIDKPQAQRYIALHPDLVTPSSKPIKNFVAGGAESITPADIAAMVGVPGTALEAQGIGRIGKAANAVGKYIPRIANAATIAGSGLDVAKNTVQGAQDIVDPNKSKLDVVEDAIKAGLGVVGVHGGFRGFRVANDRAKALKAINQGTQAASQATLDAQMIKLKDWMENLGFDPNHAESLKQHFPDVAARIDKAPAGKEAKVIWGPEGRPEPLSLVEQQKVAAKNKVAATKAEERASKLNAADAASDIQIQEEIDKAAAAKAKEEEKARKAFEKQVWEQSGASAASEKPLIKAEEKLNKLHGDAITEDERRTEEGIAEAVAERNQNAVDARLKGTTPDASAPVVERFKGEGPSGGTATTTTVHGIPEETEIPDGGSGGGEKHTPPEGTSFWTSKDAVDYAIEHGMSPDDWHITGNRGEGFRFTNPKAVPVDANIAPGTRVGPRVGEDAAAPDEITDRMRELHGKIFTRRSDAEAFRRDNPGSEIYQYGSRGRYRLQFPAITAEEDALRAEAQAAALEKEATNGPTPIQKWANGQPNELTNTPYDPEARAASFRGNLTPEEYARYMELQPATPGPNVPRSAYIRTPEELAELEALKAKKNTPIVPPEGGGPITSKNTPTGGGNEPPPPGGGIGPEGYPSSWDDLEPPPPIAPKPTKPKGPKGPKPSKAEAFKAQAEELANQQPPVVIPTPEEPPMTNRVLADTNAGADSLDVLADAHGGELPLDLNPQGRGELPVEPPVTPTEPSVEAGTKASVPLMLTKADMKYMRDEMGLTPAQYNKMTPQQGKDLIAAHRAANATVEPQVNAAGEAEPTLPGITPQVNPTPPVAEAPFGLTPPVAQGPVGNTGDLFGGQNPADIVNAATRREAAKPENVAKVRALRQQAEDLFTQARANAGARPDSGLPEPPPERPIGGGLEPTQMPQEGGGPEIPPTELPPPPAEPTPVPQPKGPASPAAPAAAEAEVPSATHDDLAGLWARYNNQRGTPKQLEKIKKQLDPTSLRRMLAERGQQGVIDLMDENARHGATHGVGLDGITRPTAETPVIAEPTPEPVSPIPARFYNSPLEAAGENYGAVKAAKKAGEAVPEAGRRIAAAGAQNETNRFADAIANGTRPTEDIDRLPEQSQKIMWDRVKQSLKNNPQGFAAIEPLIRLTGAGIGATAGYKDDPLGNPYASAATGGAAGFFAPEVVKSIAKASPSLEAGGESIRDRAVGALKYANQIHNMGLLSPFSVGKKLATDVSGLGLASLKNPDKAGAILRQFLTQEGRSDIANSFRNGWKGPDQQDLGGLNLSGKLNSDWNPASWSGKTMSGLTQATKDILGNAGFSAPEQRYYTFTEHPRYKTTQKAAEFLNSTDFMRHFVPFSKVAINKLERGAEYSPLGMFMAKSKVASEPGDRVINSLLGTGAMAGAYAATPEDYIKEHPIAAGMVSAAAGPMGLPVMAAMALKNSHKKKNDPFSSGTNASGLLNSIAELTKDVPGMNPIQDINSFVNATVPGTMQDSGKAIGRDIPGLNLIQDLDKPQGFARNYLAGYTNFMRPAALMQDMLQGETQEPDLTSKNLSDFDKLTNRMKSNVPIWRQKLPRKEEPLTTSALKIKF